MKNRSKQTYRQKKNFKRSASMTNRRNISADRPMRGGYRL